MFFAALMNLFFTGGAHDVSTVGFTIAFANGDGAPVRSWLKLDRIIQDDLAHKELRGLCWRSGVSFQYDVP